MKDLQEVISNHIEANWPMLCFLKPKANRVVFWFSHGRVFETSKTGPKFYIQAFDAQHPPEVWSGTSFDIFEIELGSFDNSSDESNAPLDMPWDAPMSQSSRALYEQMIQSAVVALKSGDMNKVVLSRTQDFSTKHLNWLDVLRRLFRVDQNAFRYLLVHPKFGLWAGASPEVLIKSKGDHFSTMALAGTRWIEQTELPKWTNKEYDEHNWVIREILHGLESAEKIQCSDTYDHKAAGVYHLRTDISGKLTHAESVLELAKKLHPTPAVCGFPKDSAFNFIRANEGYQRELYTGFVGLYDHQAQYAEFYVNLRCLYFSDDQFTLFAGGGITRESNPQKEWVETQRKMTTMGQVIAPFID